MAKANNSIVINANLSINLVTFSDHTERVVNARELHTFLEIGRDFSTWIKDRINEYGFVENQDFALVTQNKVIKKGRGGDRRSIDYFLTLDMAKELAMVEKNEKGREARRYFIECERQARQPRPDPEFVMIHKSVLDNTGKALVWMGDYGVTSQPYYGGAQPPFIDGRPAMLSDNSTRYYLSKYVGNTMEAQTLVTEDCLTQHVRNQFPALEVVHRETMHTHLMQIASNITALSGQFSTYAETKKRFTTATDNFLART